MTASAIWLLIKGLPWRWIGFAALLFGIWMHGQSVASNRAEKRILAVQQACKDAAADAQKQADARLASQRYDAERAAQAVVAAETEYTQKLKARQNELRKTTANLANCKLSVDTIRVLNDARHDASGNN